MQSVYDADPDRSVRSIRNGLLYRIDRFRIIFLRRESPDPCIESLVIGFVERQGRFRDLNTVPEDMQVDMIRNETLPVPGSLPPDGAHKCTVLNRIGIDYVRTLCNISVICRQTGDGNIVPKGLHRNDSGMVILIPQQILYDSPVKFRSLILHTDPVAVLWNGVGDGP